MLQHFTGAKDHNIALREDAVRRGLSISEYGVTVVETGEVVTHATEEELYAYLGYDFIPPELRENDGEVAAARTPLPRARRARRPPGRDALSLELVGGRQEHDRGDGARRRGAGVRVPLPHRPLALSARRRLEAQWQEIDAVNERLEPFRVLRGVEVNIRADGSLDVADEVLAELDWVVASLHTAFDRRPTERILGAIDNPHVDCIGHLTGRRI